MGGAPVPVPIPHAPPAHSSRLLTFLVLSIPTAFALFKLVSALSFPQPPSASISFSGSGSGSGVGLVTHASNSTSTASKTVRSGNTDNSSVSAHDVSEVLSASPMQGISGASFAPCYPGLASLSRSGSDSSKGRSWEIYPEDLWDGGRYVWFPLGRMRYWLFGPESGEKIVLIHGLSVPALIWKDVADALAAEGFRVLVYDLYGRGYSDAPQVAYTTGLYTTQLALLMQHVGWEHAHIAGLSMGGAIAAAFVASFPNMVRDTDKVVLIASAGLMESSDLSRTSKVMSSPVVQYLFSSAPARLLLQKLGTGGARVDPLQEIVQIQSAFLAGYDHAIASSLRYGPVRGQEASFRALGEKGKPSVLLVWGTEDRSVPYRYAGRMAGLLREGQSLLVTVEGGGHDLSVSDTEQVVRAMVDFLSLTGRG